MDNDTSVTI